LERFQWLRKFLFLNCSNNSNDWNKLISRVFSQLFMQCTISAPRHTSSENCPFTLNYTNSVVPWNELWESWLSDSLTKAPSQVLQEHLPVKLDRFRMELATKNVRFESLDIFYRLKKRHWNYVKSSVGRLGSISQK
jgi:hypothetical protein